MLINIAEILFKIGNMFNLSKYKDCGNFQDSIIKDDNEAVNSDWEKVMKEDLGITIRKN